MMSMPNDQPWLDPTDPMIEAGARSLLDHAGDIPEPALARLGESVLRIAWITRPDQLADAKLAFLLQHWRKLAEERSAAVAHQDQIDCLDLIPTLGNLILLDIERDGLDARYRVYGTNVASHAARDWTGWRVSDMNREVQTPASLLYRVGYRAAWLRQAPLFTEHRSAPWLDVQIWQRLVLPLVDDSGRCSRCLVGSVTLGERILTDQELADQRRRLKKS
ncbi:PAS domain-containing protein [Oceanibaculum pacificum]|uniref:PAS domain-containing protein n=1 Tax=Oceanibaculum pacificum TaxID=580166 RepID=A0A154W300_9PROT|nr:hypothetical protein [Oceanibaculum pacificum]KZD07945.1 hypothetical protein AUP43_09120 [Oceanibaculum pacificum]